MIPRLASRTPRTRAARSNMGQPRLESLAAEFALLAQRRSRAVHQIEVLDQQRNAAAASFAKLQKRIAWLMERMDALSPELRDPAAIASQPAPPPPASQAPPQPAAARVPDHAPVSLASIGRQWAAAQPTHHDRPIRQKRI